MSAKPSKNSTLLYGDITLPQQKAISQMYEGNKLIIAAVGFGKAVCGQTCAEELIRDKFLTRVLVVAPLKVANNTWGTEHEKWEHLGEVGLATGTAFERRTVIDSGVGIVIINIENLAWFFRTFGHNHDFDGLLIDEISKFKAVGGATMKVLRKHLKDFTWRCGMSATPIAESGMDIYSQALIIDEGKSLGRNQETFRRKYFYPVDFMGYDWEPQPDGLARLARDVKDIIFVADDGEYSEDLPELIDKRCNVSLINTPNFWKAYGDMAKEGVIEMPDGDFIEAPNAAVVQGKLQCLAAGAIYDENSEVHWVHDIKYQALAMELDHVEGPVIIAYQYLFEKAELEARYPEMVFLADTPDCIPAWNAGALPMLAIHPKSAAHGLNLQEGGHELICMGPIWSADQWQQLLGRLRRRGQKSAYVRRVTIVVTDTVDEIILDRLEGKEQDEDAMMFHVKQHATQ